MPSPIWPTCQRVVVYSTRTWGLRGQCTQHMGGHKCNTGNALQPIPRQEPQVQICHIHVHEVGVSSWHILGTLYHYLVSGRVQHQGQDLTHLSPAGAGDWTVDIPVQGLLWGQFRVEQMHCHNHLSTQRGCPCKWGSRGVERQLINEGWTCDSMR